MQTQTTSPRPEGRPPHAVSALTSRRPGTVRQSLDFRPEMLQAIAALAAGAPTGPMSRAGMTLLLLGEALAARGVEWMREAPAPAVPAKKKKGARK